jgi:phosphoribosylformylglycinamidine (FGAM) synthase-like amidotransferase family enzyme
MRNVLVLMGDGINSENELALAFSRQGASVRKVHVNELIENPKMLMDFKLLAIPGGFSFGDEIRSGKILAEKMREVLSDALSEFKVKDGRIIGICNGFQVLSQLGAFDDNGERSFTLAENDHGTFMNKWTQMSIHSDTHSPWFNHLQGEISLPVRHREGRVVIKSPSDWKAALTYKTNINGSAQEIAGLTDKSGQIFGLMPHPEVACHSFLHPFTDGAETNTQKIHQLFINGLN